jgi:hypothetical protein
MNSCCDGFLWNDKECSCWRSMSLGQSELSRSGIGEEKAWIFCEGQLREMSGYTMVEENP